MFSVSVETDIDRAIRDLNLLKPEAERAASRAINKLADEVKKKSAAKISDMTGIPVPDVYKRMYIKGATRSRLLAVVAALPSAVNVGFSPRAYPVQGRPGVTLTAWRSRTLYDKAFVKGSPKAMGSLRRKVYRRTGPGRNDISDKVWGPSIRKTFERPTVYYGNLQLIQDRWPYWFERYLRGELVKLGRGEELRGVANVLPTMSGPEFT